MRPATPLAVLVGVAITLGILAACTPSTGDRREATLGGERWELLVGDADGMRGRDGFDSADGMLFDHETEVDPAAIVYVMDGVAFPLDIAWFAGDGSLVGVAAMATCPEASAGTCPHYASPGPFRWAVEAPAGTFDDLPADARLELAP